MTQGLYGAELEAQIREQASRMVTINSLFEQMPDSDNRILPSRTETDALGIPKPETYYAIDAYVDRAAAVAQQYYDRISRLMGGTQITIDDSYGGNNHTTGTLMMGTDPNDSVVDPECRTHEHPNLFLAGTGVMPTGSTVNPTLTAVALGLRAVESIKAELGARPN